MTVLITPSQQIRPSLNYICLKKHKTFVICWPFTSEDGLNNRLVLIVVQAKIFAESPRHLTIFDNPVKSPFSAILTL
ncbi:MAG: hypothetical protein MAG581_02206 [Deltaproteobacteria bacterium]|nr:hypothetical protein [Deltaproteobacteria bacterium]